jgi:hypothetical protein
MTLATLMRKVLRLETVARQKVTARQEGRDRPPVWTPLPGPQTLAYHSQADELFYGGAAGCGKSDVLLGLAGTAHRNSIIFRRVFPKTRALIERSRAIFNATGVAHFRDSYNEQLHLWRLRDGRTIEFGSVQHDKDKQDYQGRPHDFIGWDEGTEFTEAIYRFVNIWLRSTVPGQRCRVVVTGNPPTNVDGEWVIRYWAPWLDTQHPNPARPGELRWFVRVKTDDGQGKDVEVADGRACVIDNERVQPRSRTFVPARLSDNPFLASTNYGAVLQALPEPLRSQMLYGDFSIGIKDGAWQVIPTEWVRAAQKRWKPDGYKGALTAIGVDVAWGGADKTVLAPRHGTWFGKLEVYPGPATPDGPAAARVIQKFLADAGRRGTVRGAAVQIDAQGEGASCYSSCVLFKVPGVQAVRFGDGAGGRQDKGKVLHFANLRAYAWWRMRESLDPQKGDNIALPPDSELLSDLCSPRWDNTVSGVRLEPKEDIKERIGRSPDRGDAVVLANLILQTSTAPPQVMPGQASPATWRPGFPSHPTR